MIREEIEAMAKQLWSQGRSASSIEWATHGALSRNAVIGLVHRRSWKREGVVGHENRVRVVLVPSERRERRPYNKRVVIRECLPLLPAKTKTKMRIRPGIPLSCQVPFLVAIGVESMRSDSGMSYFERNVPVCRWIDDEPSMTANCCGRLVAKTRNHAGEEINLPFCYGHAAIAYQGSRTEEIAA